MYLFNDKLFSDDKILDMCFDINYLYTEHIIYFSIYKLLFKHKLPLDLASEFTRKFADYST